MKTKSLLFSLAMLFIFSQQSFSDPAQQNIDPELLKKAEILLKDINGEYRYQYLELTAPPNALAYDIYDDASYKISYQNGTLDISPLPSNNESLHLLIQSTEGNKVIFTSNNTFNDKMATDHYTYTFSVTYTATIDFSVNPRKLTMVTTGTSTKKEKNSEKIIETSPINSIEEGLLTKKNPTRPILTVSDLLNKEWKITLGGQSQKTFLIRHNSSQPSKADNVLPSIQSLLGGLEINIDGTGYKPYSSFKYEGTHPAEFSPFSIITEGAAAPFISIGYDGTEYEEFCLTFYFIQDDKVYSFSIFFILNENGALSGDGFYRIVNRQNVVEEQGNLTMTSVSQKSK